MAFYFYILQSRLDGIFYLGQTSNLQDRLERHNQGRSRFTRPHRPWKLVYFEEFATRSEAVQRERECKSKHSRQFIEQLIESNSESG